MTFVIVLVGWIVSLCLHEFAHAAVAYVGGDTSVREKGYLTFNPLRYVDPVASIFIPLLFLLLGGIGLPGGAVYINQARLRSRYWVTLVSLAGPAANLVLAVLLGLVLHVGAAPPDVAPALAFLGLLQVTALILNLLPIPPLDGYRAISPFLPMPLRILFNRLGSVMMLALLLVLWFVPPVARTFWQATFHVADALGIPLTLALIGLQQFKII